MGPLAEEERSRDGVQGESAMVVITLEKEGGCLGRGLGFVRFLELSGLGRVVEDGTDEDNARATRMNEWVVWE